MLFKTLDSIRQKPKPVRDQYALLFAVICTFLIGGVWSLSLPSRLETAGGAASVGAASTTLPFGGMWAEFKSKFTPAPIVIEETAIATSTSDAAPQQLEALDLELSEGNISTINAASGTARVIPVTVLIGTTSTATSTE